MISKDRICTFLNPQSRQSSHSTITSALFNSRGARSNFRLCVGQHDLTRTDCCNLRMPGNVLSDEEIVFELGKSVVIHPFNKCQVAPCSYDVTLGHYYWVPNVSNLPRYLNPNNGQHISQYWGLDPTCQVLDPSGHRMYGARKADIVTDAVVAKEYGVDVGDEVIIIPPGHVILAHTQEFIGGRHNITTMLKAKSTMGRCCTSICKDAGMGDSGYYNRWTLEIENHALVPLVLKVGQRVGQIVFFRTGHVSAPYSMNGQYQKTDVLEELIRDWSPLSMIPSKAVAVLRSLEASLPSSHSEELGTRVAGGPTPRASSSLGEKGSGS